MNHVIYWTVLLHGWVLLIYSAFRKYSHPLTGVWVQLVTGLHTIPHNVKVELLLFFFYNLKEKPKAEMS
jgi:hypothetical protein